MPTLFTLAQLSAAPPPAPLPSAGPAAYLFENPWPGAVALALASAVAFVYFNRAGKAGLGVKLGALLLILGVGLIGLAAAVTTDRETITAESARLVDLAARADRTGIEAMLTSDATFQGAGGPLLDRASLLALIDRAQSVRIDSHRITSSRAVIDGTGLGRTQLRVTVRAKEATFYDAPIGSWWRLHWRRDAGSAAWRVFAVECLQIDGANPAEIAR